MLVSSGVAVSIKSGKPCLGPFRPLGRLGCFLTDRELWGEITPWSVSPVLKEALPSHKGV